MKYTNALPWLPAILALSACGGETETRKPRLENVAVTCTPTVLVEGQSAQCRASATDQDGAPFTVDSYTWTSSDSARAQVDASGVVRAQVVGTLTIRASATSGGISRQGEASLSISARSTVHDTAITSSQTWTLADSPHEVRGQLSISPSATLTLEPGVVVRFAPDAELRVQGLLLAPGSAQAPVQLLGVEPTPGSWRGLVFASSNDSSLSHVSLRGCGAPSGEGACLSLRDEAAPVLQDVSVLQSGSLGVLADADSGFGPDSSRLSVSDCTGAAVRLSANQAGTLPSSSTFSGNGANAVEVSGTVSRSQTWSGPFLVQGSVYLRASETEDVTLTIAAGSVLRFAANTELSIDFAQEDTGTLAVEGTADAPVLFTANSDNPQPGHWRGVHLRGGKTRTNRLSHVTIEYGGGEVPAFMDRGNLVLVGSSDYKSTTLIDVTLQKGSDVGLFSTEGLRPDSARLTSRDNAGDAVLMVPDIVSSLPAELALSGNKFDGVKIVRGGVAQSQTWRNLNVPYLVTDVIRVGYTNKTELTIEPGTEIRFTPNAGIAVGIDPDRPGALIAKGTAEAPIKFVPDSSSASFGYWYGLHFWRSTNSALNHVIITHGGQQGDPTEGFLSKGNINVYREQGPFITNTTLMRANYCAIVVSKGTRADTTQVTTNFFDPIYNNTASYNIADVQCVDGRT